MSNFNPYYKKMPSWGTEDIAGYGDSSTWLDEGQGGGWLGQQNIGQGVASGLSAGAANSQPVSDFEIDPYAGFKGSGQGLVSGGPIGAIIGGVTSQFGQFKKVNDNLKNLNTSVEGVTYDAYGRPVYQGGNIVNAQNNIDALNKGIEKLDSTAYKGQINLSNLDPATNIIGKLYGTKRKMKAKRAELQRNISASQQQYNLADQGYRNKAIQRNEYMERLNNNRLYNLYR